MNTCRESRNSTTPTGTAAIAATGLSISQPKKITGVNATRTGAKTSTTDVTPSITIAANATMPIGSLPSRNTSDFHVTGSRSHSWTRWRHVKLIPPSIGGWIAIRSSRRASIRSTAAIARSANSVRDQQHDADQDHREPGAGRQPRDEDRHVGDAEREGERQVEQVPVALRVPCDACEARDGRRGEAAPPAPAHQDPGCAHEMSLGRIDVLAFTASSRFPCAERPVAPARASRRVRARRARRSGWRR